MTDQPSPPSLTPVLMLTLLGDDPATTRYYDGIARTLDRSRFRLVLGTVRTPGSVLDRVAAHGHEVFCLHARSARDYPRAILQLRRLIRQHRIEIVHGNEELASCLSGIASVLAGRGKRIYHRQHDYSRSYGLDGNVPKTVGARLRLLLSSFNYGLADRIAGRLAHVVLTLARGHAETVLRERPQWRRKIAVAYHGVDGPQDLAAVSERARALRRSHGLDDESPLLVIVSRLNWRKGHRVLFDALVLLRDEEHLEPHLWIVGYGPMEAELRRGAAERKLERVAFLGRQSDVFPFFRAATLALVPSITEPFGLVAAEAMACGRPVIASRLGGLQEVVAHEETGLLVPPGEARPLAMAIARLLRSPDETARMGDAARARFLAAFSQEAMTERWEALYAGLADR